MEKKFKFELKQDVEIKCSSEKGQVTCQLRGIDCKDQFKIRYAAADGRAVENWWDESALKAAPVQKAGKKEVKKAPAKKEAPAEETPKKKKAPSKKAPGKKVRSKKAAKKK